jgi:hypothetical protein
LHFPLLKISTVEKNNFVEAKKDHSKRISFFSRQFELCIACASQPSLLFASPLLAADRFIDTSNFFSCHLGS